MLRKVASFTVSWLFLGALLLCSAVVEARQTADETASPPTQEGLPPLLDRELFFGNPEIAGAQLSPDGAYTAFLKPWKDTRNVWVKKTGESYDKAWLVTAELKRPIPGFFWSRDSRYILFVQDRDGDENFNVYAVDPTAAPAPGAQVPTPRNLTDAQGVRAQIYALPKSNPDLLLVGLNERDPAWHDLYQVRISTGERTLVRANTERIANWVFDLEGKLRLAVRIAPNGDTEILRVDPEGLVKVYSCSVFESCSPIRFHKDRKRVYMATNRGESNLVRLVLFDPATGKEDVVESDPEGRVDFGQAVFSEATDELVATAYVDERTRIYFRDTSFKKDFRFLEKRLPGKEIMPVSTTANDRLWMVQASSDSDPGTRYLFDRTAKKLTLEYVSRRRLPRQHMAPMKAIRYRSSDGLEIPAFLTLPKGVPPKHLPVVVFPHGGPWARDVWGFNGTVQFLANRGYAVLQPNFRGSTGYGKRFLNAGNKQWGDLMQDDITWGVKYLVEKGIADPKRIGIMGGSYGGYAVLAGVAFTPDLYAAGISIVGPSNLLTLLETIPPYWEAIRAVFHERMGNPNTPEGKQQLERQSPLNSAHKIKTPLLVAQGANDPRVKKAESEQIVVALRDRGFPVEYLLAPDEGHGFARPVNNMALMAAAEAFLAKHLGGRFQEGGTPEVMSRLKEITVDPKTVVLKEKVDASAVGVPQPVADLRVGETSYKGTLEAGSYSLPVAARRAIKAEGDNWIITETLTLPMGEVVDTTTVKKGSLIVTRRHVTQGPQSIELTFADDKAAGTVSMGGSEPMPIAASMDGPLFADGAGAWEPVASLPLAEGSAFTYRNFDLQKQKPVVMQAKVAGSEEITVPAGSFACWKVEVSGAEGEGGATTIWVVKDSRQVVKTRTVLPQMGGATLSTELQP